MLEKALTDFELDPSLCLMFGDGPEDMQAARRCGIFGVPVPGGRGGRAGAALPAGAARQTPPVPLT